MIDNEARSRDKTGENTAVYSAVSEHRPDPSCLDWSLQSSWNHNLAWLAWWVLIQQTKWLTIVWVGWIFFQPTNIPLSRSHHSWLLYSSCSVLQQSAEHQICQPRVQMHAFWLRLKASNNFECSKQWEECCSLQLRKLIIARWEFFS